MGPSPPVSLKSKTASLPARRSGWGDGRSREVLGVIAVNVGVLLVLALAAELIFDQWTIFGIEKLNVARSAIPAVTHVDYSARVQTVHRDTNPRYHALLSAFKARTGCPVLVNTSFNVRGEPIVCIPEDTFRCFMGTDIDLLVAENCFLLKKDQDSRLWQEPREEFAPD